MCSAQSTSVREIERERLGGGGGGGGLIIQ